MHHSRTGNGFVLESLKEIPGASVAIFGFGLTLIANQAGAFSKWSFDAGFFTLSGFLATGIFFAIGAILFGRFPSFRMAAHPIALCCCAGLMTASMLVCLSCTAYPTSDDLVITARMVQSIIANIFILLWCEMLYPLGSRKLGIIFALASLVSAGVSILLLTVQPATGQGIITCCPITSLICIFCFQARNHASGVQTSGAASLSATTGIGGREIPSGISDRVIHLLRGHGESKLEPTMYLIAFALTLFCGRICLSEATFQVLGAASSSGQIANMLGTLLAGLIILLTVKEFWNRNSIVFVSVLLLASIGFLIFVSGRPAVDPFWTIFINSAGDKCFYYLIAIMTPFFLCSRLPLSSMSWTLSIIGFGMASSNILMRFCSADAWSIILMTSVGILLACIVAFFLLGGIRGARTDDADKTQPREHLAKESDDEQHKRKPRIDTSSYGVPALPTKTDDACRSLAYTHQLTQRETEILLLLANRYNAQSIADILVVTVATVKTHMRSVYAKLEVHSQRELLDLIDRS